MIQPSVTQAIGEGAVRQLCCWVGIACDCAVFPYRKDGLIPAKCQSKIDYGLISVRPVSQAIKDVGREMDSAMRNKTFDPTDEAQVRMWEQKLTRAKASL